MKPNWKLIGFGVAAAAALVYPALKLYQFMMARKAENEKPEEDHELKTPRILHHSKHTPHHRVAHN